MNEIEIRKAKEKIIGYSLVERESEKRYIESNSLQVFGDEDHARHLSSHFLEKEKGFTLKAMKLGNLLSFVESDFYILIDDKAVENIQDISPSDNMMFPNAFKFRGVKFTLFSMFAKTYKEYKQTFLSAVEFSKKVDMCDKDIALSGLISYEDIVVPFIKMLMVKENITPPMMVAKCSIYSQYFAEQIESKLGIKAYLTAGQIFVKGKDTLCTENHFDRQFVQDTIEKRQLIPNYSHHAWITLDNLEVVDVTFRPSFSAVNSISQDSINDDNIVIYKKPTTMYKEGIVYSPTLITDKFYSKYDQPYNLGRLFL